MGGIPERRHHSRLRLDGNTVGSATVRADFSVVSLSESGAALEMDMPLSLGSECDITLNLSHVSADVRGKVVYVDSLAPPRRAHLVGVEFTSLDDTDRAFLLSFLDRERRRTS
jgi:hypothetical protein